MTRPLRTAEAVRPAPPPARTSPGDELEVDRDHWCEPPAPPRPPNPGWPPLRTSPWHHGPMRTMTSTPDPLRGLEERGDVEIAVEADLAPHRLVVDPEHVGRHRREARTRPSAGGSLPTGARDAAEMQLTGDGKCRLAVDLDPSAGQSHAIVRIDLVAHRRIGHRRAPIAYVHSCSARVLVPALGMSSPSFLGNRVGPSALDRGADGRPHEVALCEEEQDDHRDDVEHAGTACRVTNGIPLGSM